MKKIDVAKLINTADIFEIISSYVDLKKNGSEYSACCPFHDERTPSFSVSPAKNMWYCFGCGEGGDVIDFVREYHNVSFVDACKILGAEQTDGNFQPPKRKKESIKVDYYADYTPCKTNKTIDPGKSVNLINPKRDGKIWKGAKPVMIFPYRTATGELHGYVLRLEIDGKKLTPMVRWCDGPQGKGWHYYPFEQSRFLYRLPELLDDTSKQVLICEGEKAVDVAALAVANRVTAIGWSGGSNGLDKTDWGSLRGRKVILWPDNDEPGKKAMLYLAEILYRIGAESVRIITPPEDLPKGWDCADKEWTTAEFFAFCKEYVSDVPKPEPLLDSEPEYSELEQRDEPPADYYNETPEFDDSEQPFRILGHYNGKRFYLPTSTKQIIILEPSQHSKNNLLALAPLHYWKGGFGDIATRAGLDNAVNGLLQQSAKAGLFDANRMRGRGAWLDEGRSIVHMGQKMYVDGHFLKPNEIQSRYIYQQDIDLGIDLVEPLSNKEANELSQICSKLSWENPLSSTLLTGWCVIAPLTGILPWRPHIWLTGPSGSGKSTVLNTIIKPMLGDFGLLFEGKTTEAGIRQDLGIDARPVLYDEAEAEDKASAARVKAIIDFARVCSSGGTVLKGTTSGESRKFVARAMFCFSSINTSIKQFADESRISQLILKQDFKKSSDFYKELKIKIMNTITPQYGSGMLSRSFLNMKTLQDNTKIFSEAANIYFKSQRIADQIGALLAGAYLCFSIKPITREAAIKWIESHNWEDHTTVGSNSDSDRLFSKLMTHRIRVPVGSSYADMSIGEGIIACDTLYTGIHQKYSGECVEELKRIGIKIKNGEFYVANTSEPLKIILNDTPWASSWARTLKELPGSKKHNTQWFSPGIKCRSVSVPLGLLKE